MRRDLFKSSNIEHWLQHLQNMGLVGVIANMLWRYRWLWVVPAVLGAFLAVGYWAVAPKQWQASQTLLVRDELIGHLVKPGRFESWEAMKTAQETILEVARNPSVLRATLHDVGPARGTPRPGWPTERDIDSLRDSIAISAPNGGELGRTEVVLLSVRSSNPDRAKVLVERLCYQLQVQLRRVRGERAESMLAESEHAYRVALERFDRVADELGKFETSVGSDLAELRSLNDHTTSEGQLRRTLSQVMSESLSARTQLSQIDAQIEHLKTTEQDPAALVAMPAELLGAQPALSRLKDGLVDAQLRLGSLLGRYWDQHPQTQHAALAVDEIKSQIRQELRPALAGLEKQRQLVKDRMELFAGQQNEFESRLQRLAEMRVPYGKLVEQFRQQSDALNRALTEWNQANALANAAREVNLVTRVDEVRVGTRPVGPSGKMIAAGGLFAGLLFGLGLVLLASDVPQSQPAGPTASVSDNFPPVRPPSAEPAATATVAPSVPPNTPPASSIPQASTLDQSLEDSPPTERLAAAPAANQSHQSNLVRPPHREPATAGARPNATARQRTSRDSAISATQTSNSDEPQTAAAEIAPPTSCVAVLPWTANPFDQSEIAIRSLISQQLRKT